ncbi:MAG: cytidine deaminase [Methylocystaceae bacterium]
MGMLDNQQLLELAREVRDQAYVPYSHYQVGAALLGISGRVFLGCNVENASYGLTMCAERNALGAAIAAGEREFVRLAVVGSEATPAYPCGACRQVLAQFAPHLEIIIDCGGKVESHNLEELLPCSFNL